MVGALLLFGRKAKDRHGPQPTDDDPKLIAAAATLSLSLSCVKINVDGQHAAYFPSFSTLPVLLFTLFRI